MDKLNQMMVDAQTQQMEQNAQNGQNGQSGQNKPDSNGTPEKKKLDEPELDSRFSQMKPSAGTVRKPKKRK